MQGTAALALGSTLLAASAANAAGDCRIRRAEATICPAFQVFEPPDFVAGLSGDGRTLVGSVQVEGTASAPFRTVPMRWVDGRPRPLPGLPEDLFDGSAQAVSEDGSVIAGALILEGGTQYDVFRWVDGVTEIYDTGPLIRVPLAMSGDGSVFVTAYDLSGARWSEATGLFEPWNIPLAGFIDGLPSDISDDGRTAVGTAWGPCGAFPFQWIGNVTTQLPTPPLGHPCPDRSGSALGISPDGSVIVGMTPWSVFDGLPPTGCSAFTPCGAVWRGGVLERREFPVTRASWDAAFVLEAHYDGPYLVRESTGETRHLEAVLDALGVEHAAPIRSVIDLSYDGHVVLGWTRLYGGGPTFRAVISPKLGIDIEPWRHSNRIDLSSGRPVVVRIYGSEQADATQIDPDELRFGPDRAHAVDVGPARDFNRDGFADRDFVFDPAEAGLAFGDREACLAGVAAELPFRLCSRVQTTWGHRPWPFQPPPG